MASKNLAPAVSSVISSPWETNFSYSAYGWTSEDVYWLSLSLHLNDFVLKLDLTVLETWIPTRLDVCIWSVSLMISAMIMYIYTYSPGSQATVLLEPAPETVSVAERIEYFEGLSMTGTYQREEPNRFSVPGQYINGDDDTRKANSEEVEEVIDEMLEVEDEHRTQPGRDDRLHPCTRLERRICAAECWN